MNPAGLLSVPTSVNAITPLVGQILIEIESGPRTWRCRGGLCLSQRTRTGATYEPATQSGCCHSISLAKQTDWHALAHKDLPRSH